MPGLGFSKPEVFQFSERTAGRSGVSDPAGLGPGPRTRISNEPSGEAGAAGPEAPAGTLRTGRLKKNKGASEPEGKISFPASPNFLGQVLL